ncbi:MAG: lipid A-modifier LpxR family protein [Gemmatimonadaceae bacterium]
MRRRAAFVATGLLLLAPAARGQRAVSVRADNDAFNFWQMPWKRPDEEYTSGVRLTVAFDETAAWARRLGWALGACEGSASCGTHTYALGQDIYTAARPLGFASALPGDRPDAGVLWFAAASRVTRPGASNEVGWIVGVTGAPSLAEPMQRLFHSLAPRLNRPIRWGRQVPAEPVFAVSFDRRRRFTTGALELQPHGGASLGTLLTEARAGLGARYANDRTLSWLLPRRVGGLSLELTGDAELRAVARNVVLSGAFFRPGPSIALRPLVSEYAAGLRLKWRTLEAAWLAHQTGAEHVGRTSPHNWSTLVLTWRPSR